MEERRGKSKILRRGGEGRGKRGPHGEDEGER